jgi:hypothetical protein
MGKNHSDDCYKVITQSAPYKTKLYSVENSQEKTNTKFKQDFVIILYHIDIG